MGSNLDEPLAQLRAALQAMQRLPSCELLRCSPVYRSIAVGPGRQPDYFNAVAYIQTELEPLELLHALQEIECAQGRQREIRWGPRTLDLDILLYGERVADGAELTIPHPRLKERNFVLYPLRDLDPGLSLPCGTPIESLCQSIPRDGLWLGGQLSRVDSGQEY
jgi:2-amino-4-hydroxy-6-hydroxymethyldihydropteridine diphosphokinase